MRAGTVRDNERQGRRPADGSRPIPTVRPDAVLSGPWLLPGHDGRLLAYAHVDGAVLRWTEDGAGGPGWQGPDVLPAADVTRCTLIQGTNRYVHVIGRRVRGSAGGPLVVDLVYAIQYQAGRPMSEWRSVGNPLVRRERSAELGVPAGAVDTTGSLHVFAPTAEGRAVLRREDAKGRWEPWADLKATGLREAPAVVAASTGRMELLVTTHNGAAIWYQAKPGAVAERGHDLGVVPLPGSATGLETSPGRVTYVLTDLHSGGIVTVRAGEWPVPIGGAPGDGRHAALAVTIDGHPCTVLAHRDHAGRIVIGVCPTEGERYGVWWTDTGVDCLGDPVLARDARGRVVVLALGSDGAPTLARQSDGPGLTLGAWTRI